jgi:hypothetical protein
MTNALGSYLFPGVVNQPKNITTISTMQLIIWESIPKDNITELNIRNNTDVHFPRAIGSGLGCLRMSTALSRSILVEGS